MKLSSRDVVRMNNVGVYAVGIRTAKCGVAGGDSRGSRNFASFLPVAGKEEEDAAGLTCRGEVESDGGWSAQGGRVLKVAI